MNRSSRFSRALAVLASLLAVALGALAALPTPAGADQSTRRESVDRPRGPSATKPTVVLVHGAFADSSGWHDVASRLQDQGYPVLAFSNPLRGPAPDAEYLRLFLATISGPIVLVGHSYGGAVITNAATGDPDVKALVYIAAYAPDAGETVAAANTLGGGHTVVTEHLVIRPYPGAPADDADAYIDPSWFPRLFAQDLPRDEADFLAASQRPGALAALRTASGEPAWKSIPSWYMVANQDRIIPPEAERAMAERAGAYTVSINSSHVAMMSHPKAVTRLIVRAANH
jgi:pimeloyl-ACP methyl ester carboxylesterase